MFSRILNTIDRIQMSPLVVYNNNANLLLISVQLEIILKNYVIYFKRERIFKETVC